MIWLMILLMALLVFSSRYLFLEPKLPLRLGPKMLQFLSYSMPAVLTAIFAPIVFIQDNSLAISLDNYYLLCGLLAAALAWLTRNTLITIVVSMGLFFFLHQG
ncbi:AzlD domain-containing protein [Oceanicoccus sagamiensis]|uniref:Branched-chain amino acid ABC transporter n=1 Tax=Oceanicoccus sagamiensis TaxID=716816 RepID=A0A1X9NIG9_9GAMM|nr:AzlD domain-containing protein [Oceanicoccus sagamiensis]ARN76182.1 branched-chain amino acid ABC transporter [Oceanicoccus sagamiensis]